MAGLIGLGSTLNRQAGAVWESAAGLEAARNREKDMMGAAQKQSEAGGAVSGLTSGALLGSEIMPGWGTAIGAAGGALIGWLSGRHI